MRKTKFLDLPPELRNDIYKEVLLPGGRTPRYRGCTNLLRLSRQIYEESHGYLHSIPQVLDLPFCDRIPENGPPFRFYKTRYKKSKGVAPQCENYWGPPIQVNDAVDKFSALECRMFTTVTLQVEYIEGQVLPEWLEDRELFRSQDHAVRVLMGSKKLTNLTIFLKPRRPWSLGAEDSATQKPHNIARTIKCLLPFLHLGSVDTEIKAKN